MEPDCHRCPVPRRIRLPDELMLYVVALQLIRQIEQVLLGLDRQYHGTHSLLVLAALTRCVGELSCSYAW